MKSSGVARADGAGARQATVPEAMELPPPQGDLRTWIEGFAAPGGLRPMMQVIGGESGFTREGGWYATEIFPLFMGVCGDAFRFAWYRSDGQPWQRADSFAVAPPAAQYLPALEAAGFEGRVLFSPKLTSGAQDADWSETAVRREIVASLAGRRWPALVIDLPEPGWTTLVTGCEEGGETLVGWCEPGWESFGFRFEAGKKRRFGNWFAGAGVVVLLTARRPRPPEAEVLRAALTRAVPELRRRAAGHVLTGPATYEELARRLSDASLSGEDEKTARRRDALLFPMVWDLATQRHYASEFLAHAAEVFPNAGEELRAASEEFRAIHDAVWEINRLGGGEHPSPPSRSWPTRPCAGRSATSSSAAATATWKPPRRSRRRWSGSPHSPGKADRRKMGRGTLVGVCCMLAAFGLTLCCHRSWAPVPAPAPSALPEEGRAASARERFLAAHPGEKPLNWAIGEVAVRFHRARPMGRFVLHGNDCSDYAECIIDEALGVGARFKRGSPEHLIGERAGTFDYWYWEPGMAVQPGDLVSVVHSPWYAPREGSIGHVGVVGSDGMVYDFAKLRRWKSARYGRNPFAWFVRHSTAPREVIIGRLKPEYRYRLDPIPHL